MHKKYSITFTNTHKKVKKKILMLFLDFKCVTIKLYFNIVVHLFIFLLENLQN